MGASAKKSLAGSPPRLASTPMPFRRRAGCPGRALAPLFALFLTAGLLGAQETFRVATYNLENYLLTPVEGRVAKPETARSRAHANIVALQPDVLAVQEIGGADALAALQDALRSGGLDLPHAEHVGGSDPHISVGILSRFPFAARRPHTNDAYLLNGRRFRSSRGFAEVEVQVRPGYQFTLFTAHLKSKRAVAQADEAEMREEEARLLRRHVDAVLARDPKANIVVCGDFNDTKDAPSTRVLLGRGNTALVDTRPAERNGDTLPPERPGWDPRNIAWTHFYGKEDSYSRIDYILVSRGMAREWLPGETYVLAVPNWGAASDHRPLVAGFTARDR